MIEERRKHIRAKRRIPVKIADKNFDIITDTADISTSGTYCRVTRLLPLMSKIEIVLLIPVAGNESKTQKIKCKGVVVRAEPILLKDTDKAHYNVAIFFTEVHKKDQKLLEAYVKHADVHEEGAEVEEKADI